jgi:hypothetical protein
VAVKSHETWPRPAEKAGPLFQLTSFLLPFLSLSLAPPRALSLPLLTSHLTLFWILLPRHRLSALIGPSPPPPLWNPKFLPPLCFFHLPPQLGKGASKTTSRSQLASQSQLAAPTPRAARFYWRASAIRRVYARRPPLLVAAARFSRSCHAPSSGVPVSAICFPVSKSFRYEERGRPLWC